MRPRIYTLHRTLACRTNLFKAEGLCRIKELLRRNDWMCSVDLKDAHLSVPIARHHRKFLRFIWQCMTYELKCLPFDLSNSCKLLCIHYPNPCTLITAQSVEHETLNLKVVGSSPILGAM